MPKLRVGIVNYLNSKPLAWGFLKGHHADLFEPSYHPPAQVAQLLADGDLDVGLIPSIEEARSVLLVSRAPLDRIRRVALDENSRTSMALVRIVLEEGHGLRPDYVTQRADLEGMLDEADAALLIGDPALHVDRGQYRTLDLAAEWRRMTGLPFVFAVWACRLGVDLPVLPFYFKSSLRYGLSSLDILVRECAAEVGLDPAEVRDYLTRNLHYFLRSEEQAGLEEFFRRCAAKGLIAEPRPIEFWSGEREAARA